MHYIQIPVHTADINTLQVSLLSALNVTLPAFAAGCHAAQPAVPSLLSAGACYQLISPARRHRALNSKPVGAVAADNRRDRQMEARLFHTPCCSRYYVVTVKNVTNGQNNEAKLKNRYRLKCMEACIYQGLV